MDEKNKVFELEMNSGDNSLGGRIRFENCNNRVLAKIGDVMLDKLNWHRWNCAVKFLEKYEKIKIEKKFKGGELPLPPKFILEILDNGFVEDDESLQELWIKILSNWQNPNKRLDKRMIYLEIIKSLSSTEVKIMDIISKIDGYETFTNKVGNGFDSSKIKPSLQVTEEDFQLSLLNLYRCGCLESLKIENKHISMGGIHPIKDFQLEVFSITKLGINLLKNITL